jgi:hypothetical protein
MSNKAFIVIKVKGLPMKNRAIVVIISLVCAVYSPHLAQADWQLYFTGQAQRMFGAGGRGNFSTRSQCEAARSSRPPFERNNSYCFGFDPPSYTPPAPSGPSGDGGAAARERDRQRQLQLQREQEEAGKRAWEEAAKRAQEEAEQRAREERETELARQQKFAEERDLLLKNLKGPTSGVLGLKNGTDDGPRPGGTSFFGLGGGGGSVGNLDPMNDPMVVDLRHLRRASYLAQAVETASTENVPLLLDKALKTANGDESFAASIPVGAAVPAIDEKGLLAFQQANIDYAKAHDLRLKCAENLKATQRRRELANQIAEARSAELERKMANEIDKASLKKKHEMMAEIFAAVEMEKEAWAKAKAQLDAAEKQAYKTREESVRVLRALATGKDPDNFHPPIASLPTLDEEKWLEMQKRMMEERKNLDARMSKLQKELASYVPPLKPFERMHEGVILGFDTDANDADRIQTHGVSCFNGMSYAAMNKAAEQARKEGKEIGGAMVVSFGTPEQKKNYLRTEAGRVFWDHETAGEFSLATPQGQAAIERLSGKEFDRLVAHSNGASVAEALIRKDIIKVNELNVVGGDKSLLREQEYQQLLDSGKVKRVVVWINLNDPVPYGTSIFQTNLVGRSIDAAEHLAKKITGDSRIEYRYMWGTDPRNPATAATDIKGLIKNIGDSIIASHYLESSYFPNIANELGVNYRFPREVLERK